MRLFIDTHHKDFYRGRTVAYEGDAGLDLVFPVDTNFPAKSTTLVDLKIKCKMLNTEGKPISYYLYPRSSIYKTPLRMANSVGIIDSMYRHSVKVAVDNNSDKDYKVTSGTKLFQICAPGLETLEVYFFNSEETTRGEGFGSSN